MSKPGNKKPVSLSWLKLAEAPLTGEVLEIIERTAANVGHRRNTQLILAHNPPLLIAQDALSRALNQPQESGLTPRERELIAVVVSVENRCAPCVFAHSATLRQISGDPVWVGQVEVNYRHAPLTVRERALADYARQITQAPQDIEPAHLDALRQAGLSERDILDAAAIASYFNYSNRLNSALGVKPNTEAYLDAR
ncbi:MULTISPECIES: peroxidase-related enzyme [Brenneria]|uniref:Peroxidase n=1 Tax=Brenneria nigrifluens DSM 30175 = ATCC 13028 TaxID=1121120 RepID=A0A2U1ULP9_9GAMM|nr:MULTISPECIES: peroxidase-related enzyme [Brenneria]EHD19505.1 putative peroxidase-related enzyme [Brenneria sp. EniD312]PWC22578.1 peroxidase [Brenneria nigrifluens] [Brenneria nigrifluens DSM 30175 = ATCC 13028]QCR02779.1 peroxidase [Brenneria nigrifluens] [Brenneria nigrifluens DSM 30175 = ATCC 13028]